MSLEISILLDNTRRWESAYPGQIWYNRTKQKENKMTDNIEEILEERGKTHGDFKEHAEYTQRMKDMIVESEQGGMQVDGGVDTSNNMNMSQTEALEMIMHKIGRILAGSPHHNDHWDDIAGYAKLGSKACLRSEPHED